MTEKFTPGPWRLIADPYPDGSPYFRFFAGDVSGNQETSGFEFTAIMREADARLIQHSPDVLDALRELLKVSDEWDKLVHYERGVGPFEEHEASTQARALIAKIEGGP